MVVYHIETDTGQRHGEKHDANTDPHFTTQQRGQQIEEEIGWESRCDVLLMDHSDVGSAQEGVDKGEIVEAFGGDAHRAQSDVTRAVDDVPENSQKNLTD